MKGSSKGLDATQVQRLRVRLAALNAALELEQLSQPGWNLHELKGERQGTWSLKVTAQWRLTFEWNDETKDCLNVDCEQYH